jgi:hypothetical protein
MILTRTVAHSIARRVARPDKLMTSPVLIPQELTPGAISVESTGTASVSGKSYEALKATSSDLEILLYLDSSHKLIRLEAPPPK